MTPSREPVLPVPGVVIPRTPPGVGEGDGVVLVVVTGSSPQALVALLLLASPLYLATHW